MYDTLRVFLKAILQKVNFKKKSADDKKSMKYYTDCKELRCISESVLEDFFSLANSADEMLHVAAFHLGLCCSPNYLYTSFQT